MDKLYRWKWEDSVLDDGEENPWRYSEEPVLGADAIVEETEVDWRPA